MGKYLSKPPLLFWMLSGMWALFGMHNWVIHFLLLSILSGVLYSSQYLYQLLFDNAAQAKLVPVIVLGSFLFFARGTTFCFDSIVVLFFLWSAIGVALALKHYYLRGFIVYGMAVGLGVLAKGPIILGFSLPFFIVATSLRHNYHVQNRAWFLGFLLSLVIIISLLMVWLLPVLRQLSPAGRHMLLLHRGFGIGNTYGHAPFYFYVKACLWLFFPWLLWSHGRRSLWHSIINRHNVAFKLVLYSLFFSLVVLSIVPPKALRYIMSSAVLFALLYTYALFQNKVEFNGLRHSTRSLIAFFVSVVIFLEVITLCFPEWVMVKISYPAITYAWVISFENMIIFAGGILLYFKGGDLTFEALRLCGFTFVLVLAAYVFPHEVMSKNFAYQSFVNYLNELKKQNIPIVYCRAYGGYQYSVTELALPEAKYRLTTKESQPYDFVYLVKEVKKKKKWLIHSDYLYRLVDPSQTLAIFVSKIPVQQVVALNFKKQRC